LDDDIFAIPEIPTKAYMGPMGCCPPKIPTIWPPTWKEDPGDEWSTPLGSKTTPSYAHRIGQSTFQTSLPRLNSLSRTVSEKPQTSQVYVSSVLSSSYAVTVVRSFSQLPQYGLYGK
jgi:hypothetical protein